MKFNIKSPQKPITETPQPKSLQLGKPKIQMPSQTLAERTQTVANRQSTLNSLLANDKKPTKPVTTSGLDSILKGNAEESAKPIAEREKAQPVKMAHIGEKYVLTAEATEQLPQSVLEDYASKMQHLVNAMDTNELPTALHTVLNFAQENPHLRDILRAEDVQLVVRAARQSYGLTVQTKATNTTRSKKQTQLAKDIMADLADVSFTV